MILTFWGVRASTPVPGPSTIGFGGNTVCLDITLDDGSCRAILDSGTGIIMLGKKLLAGPCGKGKGDMHIFLSHTHWDHIQGFPFFIPGFIPGNRVTFHGRSASVNTLKAILEGQMRVEYNPIFELANMGSTIAVDEFGDEPVAFGPFTMRTLFLPHRGEASFGYRISDGKSDAVLMGDVHHEEKLSRAIVDFASDADLLVHDAGDSALTEENEIFKAVRLALTAGIKRIVFTHYAPWHTDDDVAALVAKARKFVGSAFTIEGAREGLTITL